jgi:NAD dependent epimerase/dehydratase family enzyme
MNLVITGASGFIGSNLVERLWKQIHTLKLMSRKPRLGMNVPKKEWLSWELGVPGEWQRWIDGTDGIIHLAGEPIAAKRWGASQKGKFVRVESRRPRRWLTR